MSLKNSNDTIWDRTSDLPVFVAQHLTTVPSRSPQKRQTGQNINLKYDASYRETRVV